MREVGQECLECGSRMECSLADRCDFAFDHCSCGEPFPELVENDFQVSSEPGPYCGTCLWTELDCLCVPEDKTPDYNYQAGWRDGYAAALADLLEFMNKRKDTLQ